MIVKLDRQFSVMDLYVNLEHIVCFYRRPNLQVSGNTWFILTSAGVEYDINDKSAKLLIGLEEEKWKL